ncbi:2,3-bisphosphoglycerate-independent phosphoglycerate mutase [Methanopyrus kandleri]
MRVTGLERKILVIVGDGMADRAVPELDGKTPLQAADTPNMDRLAREGSVGLLDPIRPGVRPGSDTAHLALLGYDPFEVYPGRGPLEALGAGVEVRPGDVAFRCNFATAEERDGELVVVDRRAGRINEDEGTPELAETINEEVDLPVEFEFKEAVGHRAVLVLRGDDLSADVTDADPKRVGKPVKDVKPTSDDPAAARTAEIVNEFVRKVYGVLKDHPVNRERKRQGKPPANVILPRGAGQLEEVEPFSDRYGMRGAVVAGASLIKGIGRMLGMDVPEDEAITGRKDTDLKRKAELALEALDDYDLVLVNFNAVDEAGHDGDARGKVEMIERMDRELVGTLLEGIDPEETVVCLTADHSTPVAVGDHTADPVPVVIWTADARRDPVEEYDEISAARGCLGRFSGLHLLDVLRDLADRIEKFGA